MPACTFTRAPTGCSHAQAATLPCAGVTAWRGLVVQGRVKPGDTVLVTGSGAVSLFALQFAKAAGARVIATSSSEEKLEKLERLGADDSSTIRATPNWGGRPKPSPTAAASITSSKSAVPRPSRSRWPRAASAGTSR